MRNYRLQLPKSSSWKISLHRNTANLLGGGIESINFTTTKLPPPPPPGKTFDNKCPTLGSLWPCYPFVSARFSSPIKKGEEKRKPDRFSFCSSRLQRIWIRLSQLKPTDLQLFAGVFPVVMVTSFVHLACTIRLFRVEGILVSNQAGCLLFFWFEVISFLYLLAALIALSIIKSALSLWSTS